MNILIESITPARYRPREHNSGMWSEYTIRCWREEPEYNQENKANTRREIEAEIERMGEWVPLFDVAKRLIAIDRMNAVEVKDITGEGCVLYKNWP